MSNSNQNNPNRNLSQPQDSREQIDAAVASTNSVTGSFQAIATAYSDYTKKSFEDTRSYVEKLSGVKSVDKAIEIQTEFAKSAFETFMAEFGRLARCIAIWPRNPTNRSVVFLPRRPRQIDRVQTLAMSAQNSLLIAGLFYRGREPAVIFRGDIMSNANPPFQNLSLDPAEMIAVNEAYELACRTLQNIGQLEVDREIIARGILRAVKAGERNANKLCERAIHGLTAFDYRQHDA